MFLDYIDKHNGFQQSHQSGYCYFFVGLTIISMYTSQYRDEQGTFIDRFLASGFRAGPIQFFLFYQTGIGTSVPFSRQNPDLDSHVYNESAGSHNLA